MLHLLLYYRKFFLFCCLSCFVLGNINPQRIPTTPSNLTPSDEKPSIYFSNVHDIVTHNINLSHNNSTIITVQPSSNSSISVYNKRIFTSDVQLFLHKLESGNVTSAEFRKCFGMSHTDISSLISKCLLSTSSLKSMSFIHCGIDKDSFSKVKNVKTCLSSSLEYLDLSFNPLHKITAEKDIVTSFFDNISPTLSDVSNIVTSSSSKAKSSKLKNKSSLAVSSYAVVSSVVRRLIGLKRLSLDGNTMDSEDFDNIVYACRRHPSINDISLSLCDLTDDMIESLGFLLKSNYNITRLNLSMNKLSGKGMYTFASIFKSPSAPSAVGQNLKYLDLSYNPLGADGITILADLIKSGRLPSLEYLLLRQIDGATQPAMSELLSSFGPSSKLIYLDISGNRIFSIPPHLRDAPEYSMYTKQKSDKKNKLKNVINSVTVGMNTVSSQYDELKTQLTPAVQLFKTSVKKSMNGLFQNLKAYHLNSLHRKSKIKTLSKLKVKDSNKLAAKTKPSKQLAAKKVNKKQPTSSKKVTRKAFSNSFELKNDSDQDKNRMYKKESLKNKKDNAKQINNQKAVDIIKKKKKSKKLSSETIMKRLSEKRDISTIKSIFQLLKNCVKLRRIGLSKIGLSDSIVTNAMSILDKQLKVNNSATEKPTTLILTSHVDNTHILTKRNETNVHTQNNTVNITIVPARVLPKYYPIFSNNNADFVRAIELEISLNNEIKQNTTLDDLIGVFKTVILS